jgi:hypothetical protein
MMFPGGNDDKKKSVALAICLLLLPMLAGRGFAATEPDEPLILLVRPESLPDSPAAAGNFLFTTRNPFVWPANLQARLEQLDGAPRPDPFEDLVLDGIIWGGSTPVAIINNKELRTGDMIADIKVTEISRDSVVLTSKKTSRILRFPSAEIDFSITPAEVE